MQKYGQCVRWADSSLHQSFSFHLMLMKYTWYLIHSYLIEIIIKTCRMNIEFSETFIRTRRLEVSRKALSRKTWISNEKLEFSWIDSLTGHGTMNVEDRYRLDLLLFTLTHSIQKWSEVKDVNRSASTSHSCVFLNKHLIANN
jgi:hypothetical protein